MFPPYKVTWGDDSCADELVYLSGEKITIASGMRFAKTFKFRDPSNDRDCVVTGPGDLTICLHRLWPLGQGPHKLMELEDGSSLKSMAEDEERVIEEELRASRAGQLETLVDTGTTPEKALQKRKALEVARQGLRQKRSKLEVDCST